MSSDPLSTHGNTYVFDPENATEMARLINLDRFMTKAMGGPLAEQAHHTTPQRILDIACGPGGWVLEVAHAHPDYEVAGIDISKTMIAYAHARAHSQGINNATFGVMNILHTLDFSDHTFDLVNARFLAGVLKRQEWSRFLRECRRITRPGGVIRLTEGDSMGLTNSPAFEALSAMTLKTIHTAGYGFSPDGRGLGITPMLERFLRDADCQNVQSRAYVLNFSAGNEPHIDMRRNVEIVFSATQPILLKAGVTTQEEFAALFRQMQIEALSDDFCGISYFITSWGTTPSDTTHS